MKQSGPSKSSLSPAVRRSEPRFADGSPFDILSRRDPRFLRQLYVSQHRELSAPIKAAGPTSPHGGAASRTRAPELADEKKIDASLDTLRQGLKEAFISLGLDEAQMGSLDFSLFSVGQGMFRYSQGKQRCSSHAPPALRAIFGEFERACARENVSTNADDLVFPEFRELHAAASRGVRATRLTRTSGGPGSSSTTFQSEAPGAVAPLILETRLTGGVNPTGSLVPPATTDIPSAGGTEDSPGPNAEAPLPGGPNPYADLVPPASMKSFDAGGQSGPADGASIGSTPSAVTHAATELVQAGAPARALPVQGSSLPATFAASPKRGAAAPPKKRTPRPDTPSAAPSRVATTPKPAAALVGQPSVLVAFPPGFFQELEGVLKGVCLLKPFDIAPEFICGLETHNRKIAHLKSSFQVPSRTESFTASLQEDLQHRAAALCKLVDEFHNWWLQHSGQLLRKPEGLDRDSITRCNDARNSLSMSLGILHLSRLSKLGAEPALLLAGADITPVLEFLSKVESHLLKFGNFLLRASPRDG